MSAHKCPLCGRESDVDRVCVHGKANVTMKPLRVISGSRFEIFHFSYDTTQQDFPARIPDTHALIDIGVDIESIQLVNPSSDDL